MKLPGIKLEYIQKHTPEDNGDIESFHNSIKTDYIWPNEFMDFHDASIAIGKVFTDYNECRPHSSIDIFLQGSSGESSWMIRHSGKDSRRKKLR